MKRRKLDMDANSAISAFISSSNQYVVCENEMNLMQLQRHLEILVCLTTTSSDLGIFLSGNPLSSQCITHVVNLLLANNTKCSLIPRALSFLQNLSKCSHLNKNLQSTFHVHSAISVFLQHYGTDVKDPLVVQCLHLLQSLTYDITIDYIESHFENLINVLLKMIDSDSSQLLKISLRILANVTRHNTKVQNYICSLPTAKQNIKKIINMLNTEGPHVLVYALSILANLTPNYHVVAKLWTEEHLMQTFTLILKLLFGSDETCTSAALDLFLDLIRIPNYQSCFVKSPYLNAFLKRIPKVLHRDNVDQSVVYLQILYALVKIPDCSKKVCSALCISEEKSEDKLCEEVQIHPKIMQWCIDNENEKAHRLSLKLLKNFLIINVEIKFSAVEKFSKEIIKNILSCMIVPSLNESSLLEKQLEAHITIFETLIFLCMKTDMKPFISQFINLTVCEEIAEMLLSTCKTDECESNGRCIELFLMILEVISMIEVTLPESEKLTSKILNNERAMQFLAYSLTSNSDEFVKRGLLLISLTKNESSLNILSKSLLLRNSNLQKRFAHNSDFSDFSFVSDTNRPIKKSAVPQDSSVESNIDSLLLKIEQGLNIKELKRSDIMDLYEHKIATLTRKEQELQNYVEAKTIALQKADQIMTQYKCRQADLDAEALRLRTMLKDFEFRCEKATIQFEAAQKECKRKKSELDDAVCKIKELQQSQKEQNDLLQIQMSRQYEQKKSFEEEKARLAELIFTKDSDKKVLTTQLQQMEEDLKMKCKELEALEEIREDLVKKVEELKLATEKMKQNFEFKISNLESTIDSAQQTILTLQEKNDTLINEFNVKVDDYKKQILELETMQSELKEELKLKDSKNTDLKESIKNLNIQLNDKDNILRESELSNNKLKSVVENTENKNAKLEQDIKMLELLCKRYETSIEKKDEDIKAITEELEDVQKQCQEEIEEKNNQIEHLESELEKHKYITGMIHQMTSGKIPPPK